MIPTLRWRDVLPGLAAYFAQPLTWCLLFLAAGYLGGRCSRTPEKVVQWRTQADALTNRDALSLFHGTQAAGADTARRQMSHADTIAAQLRHPPTVPPTPPAFDRDSLTRAAFDSGYTAGYRTAADVALAALSEQRAAYARVEALRRAAVTRADSLATLVRTAPLAKGPPRLTCGPGLAYAVTATGTGPALTLGCHIPLLRF